MKKIFRDCVAVFVRAPEAGTVKTRLQGRLGPERTAALYKFFVIDLLSTLNAGNRPVNVFFHPPSKQAAVENWLKGAAAFTPQSGRDLGAKMANAFGLLFESGFQRVVLVGSDIPDLPGKTVESAFDRLDACDAVIGPAEDGGYFLIGFRKNAFAKSLFIDMPWGSTDVFEKTVERYAKTGRRLAILDSWPDIDTYEDLTRLSARNSTDEAAPHTLSFLRTIGLR